MNSENEKYISIVIPNYNRANTVGKCLEAAFASQYKKFEVIVVDDHSDDNSVEIIEQYPCRLIVLDKRSGASKARNEGASQCKGEIIFFTDSDCLMEEDTLSIINSTWSSIKPDMIVGGTYTRMAYDEVFFSIFQSVFVNYSESMIIENPDYIAAHAMIIDVGTFRKNGGFPEVFLPIIEDVEFSHRLKRAGCSLLMAPLIQVRHIFNFKLLSSLRNAYRKSFYWNIYSLSNRNVLADSGSASYELKTDVAAFLFDSILLGLWVITGMTVFLYLAFAIYFLNLIMSRHLLKAFYETNGFRFGTLATMYYTMLYPLPVGLGFIAAVVKHIFGKKDS